jgi:hypothetical protein
MTPLEIKDDRNLIKGKWQPKRTRLTGDKLEGGRDRSRELLGQFRKLVCEARAVLKGALK